MGNILAMAFKLGVTVDLCMMASLIINKYILVLIFMTLFSVELSTSKH